MSRLRLQAVAAAGGAAVLFGILAGPGCRARPAPVGPEARAAEILASIPEALRSGRPGKAREQLERARSILPREPAVLLWDAVLSAMYWEDEVAVERLFELRRLGGAPDVPVHEIDGRIGDLLVARAGNHARARGPLRRASLGPQAGSRARRAALANLVELLPPRRDEPASLATELPLIGGRLPRLACRFSGREIPFVLDTGATFTTVEAGLAEDLGVRTVDPPLTVTDGRGAPVAARFGVLPAMSLGAGVSIDPRPVLVVDGALLPVAPGERSASALVGLDLLARYRVTLDPERETARFELPRGQEVEDSVQTILWEGQVLVPIECELVRMWFVLDTGASRSSLTAEGLEILPGGARRARETLLRASAPGGTTVVGRMVEGVVLRVGSLRVADLTLPIVTRAGGTQFPVHGVLGSDILSECRITLDRGRLRLEARGD